MVSEGFASATHSLGKLWRTKRRSLPLPVREAFLDLLIVMQPYFLPSEENACATNIAEARQEVSQLVVLCKDIASRPPVPEHAPSDFQETLPPCAPPPVPPIAGALHCHQLEAQLFAKATHCTPEAVGLICNGCGLWTPLGHSICELKPISPVAGCHTIGSKSDGWNVYAPEFQPQLSMNGLWEPVPGNDEAAQKVLKQVVAHDEKQFVNESAGCLCPSDTPHRPELNPAPGDEEMERSHLHIGAAVTLRGLTSADFNGKSGNVATMPCANGRIGVQLCGFKEVKSFKTCNLAPYHYSDTDKCTQCGEVVNLNAFPACGCGLQASDSDEDPEGCNELLSDFFQQGKSGTNLGSDFFVTRAELVELMREHGHPQVECDAIETTYPPESQFCASQLFALLGS